MRMVPEKAVEADKAELGAVAKEEALGSGTADPAADMFNAKVRKRSLPSSTITRHCFMQPVCLCSSMHS